MNTFEFLQYQVEQEHIQLEKLLDRVNDDDLLNPLFGSETTIGKRFSHIIEAEYRMSKYLYQSKDDIDEFKVETQSVEKLLEKSKISMKRHLLTLANLDENDLDRTWKSQVSGNEYEYKYLLWHFIEHIATHRGQLATAIRMLKH